jgi:geranylgeranylglycerol-phosphate geranylgeranyltransferase
MLKEYYRLSRPVNALAGCIAVFLSGYVAGAETWLPVILAAVTVLFITASTNAWNDYVDIKIDKINKPGRPLPAGLISPRGALTFSITGSTLSLVTASFINQPAFLIALGSNILLYLYSWKLKCTILWGNAAVATIIGLCFIFGGVAAGNVQPTLMLAVTVFFAILAREILKTMADYRGDMQHNCNTIATVWGKKIAWFFVPVFWGIAAAAMTYTHFHERYSIVYLLIVLIVLFPLFIYIVLHSRKNTDGDALERNAVLMKYGYFVWFLAVALGAGLSK